jgi:malate dehydrogenase
LELRIAPSLASLAAERGCQLSKVTVVGAGKYGSAVAHLLALGDVADEIVLIDVVEGLPQGLALDINQSRYLERHRSRVIGTNKFEETAGSSVVVITAGRPRKPGMSRTDLLVVNSEIVGDVVGRVSALSPEAVLMVSTNPLDQMTLLAAEVSGFPRRRVMGQAGLLDTARFAHFIAEAGSVDVLDVEALVLGSHGEGMVPVPSQCLVAGKPLLEVLNATEIAAVVQRTRDGGDQIVSLLRAGGAYFAPASATVKMVRAVLEDSGEVMPVCAWVTGQYGISDVYLGVPAALGAAGIGGIIELALTVEELNALKQAASVVVEKETELHRVLPLTQQLG